MKAMTQIFEILKSITTFFKGSIPQLKLTLSLFDRMMNRLKWLALG
jgi:hypothetical protein